MTNEQQETDLAIIKRVAAPYDVLRQAARDCPPGHIAAVRAARDRADAGG